MTPPAPRSPADTSTANVASAVALAYASPRNAARAREAAEVAAFIACAAALGIICYSTMLAQDLIGWGSCGTGRHEATQHLYLLMPATCSIPAGCWWFAHTCAVRVLTRLCRLSFLASLAAWTTCALFAA